MPKSKLLNRHHFLRQFKDIREYDLSEILDENPDLDEFNEKVKNILQNNIGWLKPVFVGHDGGYELKLFIDYGYISGIEKEIDSRKKKAEQLLIKSKDTYNYSGKSIEDMIKQRRKTLEEIKYLEEVLNETKH